MSQTDYDCIVIGGSANGAQAAHAASKRGLRTAIIEEHPKIGLPEHCSGLFSYWGLEYLDCMPPDEIIFNHSIDGSRIISPNGKILTVRKDTKHAIVCDRAAFDKFLLDRALSTKTDLFQPYKAADIFRKENYLDVELKSNDEKITLSSPLVISAEGIRATITNKMDLSGPNPDKFVRAAQFYMYDLQDIDSTLVELYQSKEFALDFFAWVIPMTDTSAKIGLGTSRKNASKELEKMIKEHPILKEKCKGADLRRKTAGRIPTTGPVKKTYKDNFMITGDVAGQTKPTTGGGVILGGIAAQLAGKTAFEAYEANNFSSKFLSRYQKQWKKEIYWNLRLMKIVRNYMNRLSDDEVSKFFQTLERKGILSEIEQYGHVDDQGVLVKKFMKTLSLYPFYLRTSFRLLKSIF